ncbi:MAG: hypothetical protein PUA92_08440 [Clostridium sp.]|nr:hypothetical protein [Clostridium sp.]
MKRRNMSPFQSISVCLKYRICEKHNLMHVLPLFWNSDYWGISRIHGILIRYGTCGKSGNIRIFLFDFFEIEKYNG